MENKTTQPPDNQNADSEEKTPLNIAVIGDDVLYNTINVPNSEYWLDEKEQESEQKSEQKSKDICGQFLINAGAKRIVHMLEAIQGKYDNQSDNRYKINQVFVDPKIQIEDKDESVIYNRHALLKRYELADDFEPLNKALELKYVRPYRYERTFGTKLEKRPVREKIKEDEITGNENVWIVYLDKDYNLGVKIENFPYDWKTFKRSLNKERKKIRDQILDATLEKLLIGEQPPTIFWYPLDFGKQPNPEKQPNQDEPDLECDPIANFFLSKDKDLKNLANEIYQSNIHESEIQKKQIDRKEKINNLFPAASKALLPYILEKKGKSDEEIKRIKEDADESANEIKKILRQEVRREE